MDTMFSFITADFLKNVWKEAAQKRQDPETEWDVVARMIRVSCELSVKSYADVECNTKE